MATHNRISRQDEFYLHVDPSVDQDDIANFELSNCNDNDI
jgi:hypothetical protein